jgi:hypothetical protein
VVILVVFETTELLTVVIFVVFETTELLTVVILVVFETPALLTVVILVVFETPALLTILRLLLTVASPAVMGRLVIKEPSPTKRPNTVPAEIVEKKPNEVDIDTAEILDTARRKLVVLLTVIILFVFETTELLTVVILVVFETPALLTVVRLLLTVVIFPEFVTPVLLTETKAEESEISVPLLIVAA